MDQKWKKKWHKLNKRTRGHYLDTVLIVDFLRLLTRTVTINVQHLTWAATEACLVDAPDLCLVPGLSRLVSSSSWGVLSPLFLPPPSPFPSFSPTQTQTHTHTHQRSLSCGSLINNRLSGKWHLWWLQHFCRTLFFFQYELRGKDANEDALFRAQQGCYLDYRSWCSLAKTHMWAANFVQNYEIYKRTFLLVHLEEQSYCYSIIIAPISWSISSEALDLCCSSAWWMLLHLISAERHYPLSSIQLNFHQVAHQSGA